MFCCFGRRRSRTSSTSSRPSTWSSRAIARPMVSPSSTRRVGACIQKECPHLQFSRRGGRPWRHRFAHARRAGHARSLQPGISLSRAPGLPAVGFHDGAAAMHHDRGDHGEAYRLFQPDGAAHGSDQRSGVSLSRAQGFESGHESSAAQCPKRSLLPMECAAFRIGQCTPCVHWTRAFRELHDGVCPMANVLRSLGVVAGDRVMLLAKDGPAFSFLVRCALGPPPKSFRYVSSRPLRLHVLGCMPGFEE